MLYIHVYKVYMYLYIVYTYIYVEERRTEEGSWPRAHVQLVYQRSLRTPLDPNVVREYTHIRRGEKNRWG